MDSVTSSALSIVTEVPAGAKVALDCKSNDDEHNFMFWILDATNKVIGPRSYYDERKYKYEVLSGKLYIDRVSPEESGFYKCVSKKVSGLGYAIGEVEMIVKGSKFAAMDAVKLIAIVLSIVVLISCAVIYFRLRREWNKYDGRAVVPVDDTEEDEGDEIYNRTTTTISQPQPVAGPSRNQSSEHLLYGIDNQGLDTDFNSVFENIQIKSPSNLSLI